MRDVEIDAAALAAPCPAESRSTRWRGFLARLSRRNATHYVVSEHSPDYLLHDLGIIDGRPWRFVRDRQKLPEWR